MRKNSINISGNSGSNTINCQISGNDGDSCITINGCTISGSTISGSIINGIHWNNFGSLNMQKVDEQKVIDATGIQSVSIESKAGNIHVHASDQPVIVTHLQGEVPSSTNFSLSVHIENAKLVVKIPNGSTGFSNNVSLDVTLPKRVFNELSVESVSGKIKIDEEVMTENLDIESVSGKIETQATFTHTRIHTKSGKMKLLFNAKRIIYAEVSSTSGSVRAKLKNASCAKIVFQSASGKLQKCFEENANGCPANIWITTLSGNAFIY